MYSLELKGFHPRLQKAVAESAEKVKRHTAYFVPYDDLLQKVKVDIPLPPTPRMLLSLAEHAYVKENSPLDDLIRKRTRTVRLIAEVRSIFDLDPFYPKDWFILDDDFRYALLPDLSRVRAAKALRLFMSEESTRSWAEALGEYHTMSQPNAYRLERVPAHLPYESPVVKSCMTGKDYAIQFYRSLYEAGYASAMYLIYNRTGKPVARTIIWNTPHGVYHDRLYVSSPVQEVVFAQLLQEAGIRHVKNAPPFTIPAPEGDSRVYLDNLRLTRKDGRYQLVHKSEEPAHAA